MMGEGPGVYFWRTSLFDVDDPSRAFYRTEDYRPVDPANAPQNYRVVEVSYDREGACADGAR